MKPEITVINGIECCTDCGRKMIPAPSWFDGQRTTVGFMPCRCSWCVYLDRHEDGEDYAEYKERINRRSSCCDRYDDECDCEAPDDFDLGFKGV